MKKSAQTMKGELKGIKATKPRLEARVKMLENELKNVKKDMAKDKRMKGDLKRDVKKADSRKK